MRKKNDMSHESRTEAVTASEIGRWGSCEVVLHLHIFRVCVPRLGGFGQGQSIEPHRRDLVTISFRALHGL